MKQCPTCQEEFADKFGFCPVDGTPLNGHVAASVVTAAPVADEPSIGTAAPSGNGKSASNGHAYANGNNGAAAHGDGVGDETVASAATPGTRDEFHLTFLEDTGLTRRLATVLKEVAHDAELTWPEFKRDPVGFTKRSATAYSQVAWKFFSQRNVALATLSSFVLIFVIIGGVFALERLHGSGGETARMIEGLEVVGWVPPETEIPKEEKKPDEGPAGTNKGKGGGSKQKYEKPGGGGGGGNENPLPVSFGKIAPGRMEPQIMAPNVRQPTVKDPQLKMSPSLQGDPLLLPEDKRPIPFGDPKSMSTTPSDGPGKGGGQGTGTGSGQGPGDGKGYGPGRGENVGGGDPNYGGGGPGGGGGGRDAVDYKQPFKASDVTRKAQIHFKPEPSFTEEARKNNVTGVVRLRAILSASGAVTSISPIKGLPDGLTEQAIAAARQIKFTPAQKDGHTVSQWVTLEYNFNIY